MAIPGALADLGLGSEEPFPALLVGRKKGNNMNRYGFPTCIVTMLLRNASVIMVPWGMLRYREGNGQLQNVGDLGSYVVSVRGINIFTIWRYDLLDTVVNIVTVSKLAGVWHRKGKLLPYTCRVCNQYSRSFT